ncbi:unnamed protein product, partial [Pleuronectes platessa]
AACDESHHLIDSAPHLSPPPPPHAAVFSLLRYYLPCLLDCICSSDMSSIFPRWIFTCHEMYHSDHGVDFPDLTFNIPGRAAELGPTN